MENGNPITDVFWLLGDWEGEIVENGQKFDSTLNCEMFGEEIVKYTFSYKDGKKPIREENGFFLYDKTREKIKHLIINNEGYFEMLNVNIENNAKEIRFTSYFESGYNIPPNIKIERVFAKESKTEMIVEVKIGESLKTYSKTSLSKK